MEYVVEPVQRTSLPVSENEGRFPVQDIYCVGRNYADHAIEMGHDPDKEAPFFFIKPAYAVLQDGEEMEYPALSHDVHHEVELVVAIGTGGRNILLADAMSHVYGYAVGIDMTRRDLQQEAKDKSRPWDAGKTFVHAAPCSAVVPITQIGELNEGMIELHINSERRQSGNINQMIWKVPEVIVKLSELFQLQAGDLIFTGTPAGVGPIQKGDELLATIEQVGDLRIKVAQG